MATMRTYGDGCGIAHALDLLGERWALLVVRELLLGPKRYTDLRDGLPNVSPNVLAQRLRELEGAGVVQRRKLPPPAASSIYELTEWGRGLKPILVSLGTWAVHSPSFPHDAPVGIDSVILALSTFFDADAAGDLSARYELRLGEHVFDVRVADRTIAIAREPANHSDAIIETDVDTFRGLIWGERELADALRAGDIRIEGDRRAVTRFVELFPQPQPVAPAA
jgi:DNA-binding HxlR family transcriptional regulator/putative sterol carrier protein